MESYRVVQNQIQQKEPTMGSVKIKHGKLKSMLQKLPGDLDSQVYSREMDHFEKTSLINVIEEMWSIFRTLLDLVFNKQKQTK